MNKEKNVERVFNLIERWLTRKLESGGSNDYVRILEAIDLLVDKINELEETENIWFLGECCAFTVDDLIIGAYWHLTEWHGGQNSMSYAVLCSLATIFNPNMSTPEDENQAYICLNNLANEVVK